MAFTILLLFTMLPVGVAAAGNYADAELARAVSIGVGSYRSNNPTVTFAQFFAMLDKTVQLSDQSKLTAWRAKLPAARKSSKAMTRYDGMFSLFLAAETLGGDYFRFTADWQTLHEKIGEPWDDVQLDSLFSAYNDKTVVFDGNHWNYDATAYFYSFGRTSLYSGKTIFDYDSAKNSMRPAEPFTYTEALLAALRLHDSSENSFPVTYRWPLDSDKAILQNEEDKKAEVLNSPTSITVTGKKYYVSNTGNDNNNGLTPTTAWATLQKVNAVKDDGTLRAGDGVFFERGDLWRGMLQCAYGVTYSAYGTGEKPRLYGSPENGTGSEKWTLWYNKNGIKIWKFYRNISDCGNIVFNDGQSNASRVFSYWNGKQAVFMDDKSRSFDIVVGLQKDLQFYSTFDGMNQYQIPFWVHDVDSRGPLYLRCDRGNPGELYQSIEFQSSVETAPGYSGIVDCGGNNVIDNLCVMYRSTVGLDVTLTDHNTFQNCEVGWIGGGTHQAGYEGYVPTSGECVRMEGNDNTVKNCYIHDGFDGGVTIEFDSSGLPENYYYKNMTVTGNVIERCMSGVLVSDHNNDPNARSTFGGVAIADNDVFFSGYGWSCSKDYNFTWGDEAYEGNAITLWDGPNINDGITIKNNTLYLSKFALVHMGMDHKNQPTFSGNTYVQNQNGVIAYMRNTDNAVQVRNIALSDTNSRIICTKYLGDQTANVLSLSVKPSDLGEWAVPEVVEAMSRGLVTTDLQINYKAYTTRAEFCRAAVNFLERYDEKAIAEILKDKGLAAKTFSDTSDPAIAAAAALGITQGTNLEKNIFSPDLKLTREQAAAMLTRTLYVMGASPEVKSDILWADAGSISGYAADAINTMYLSGVMNGTSATALVFSPQTPYTHEQSIVTFDRLYKYVQGSLD